MTLKEFNDYILSFNKKPGEYSDDEIYQIGVAHKKLDNVSDKNWNELAQKLGLTKTGEALRVYVKSRQLEDGTLPKNTRELSNRTMEDITSDELQEKLDELYKQQVRTRDMYNAYRKNLRVDARLESFKDEIKVAISNLEKLPKFTYSGGQAIKNSECEAILMLSDFHIGVVCSNFYNTYNIDVARKRVNKLVDDTINYCKIHRIKRLNVINLGDMIHGLIHTNARIEQEMVVTEQVIIASEILSEALNRLQLATPEVIYRSVIDNHSRAVAKIGESIAKENFSKLIDWFLEERLKSTKIKFADDNIDDGMGKFYLQNGKCVMFAHGHQDNANQSFQHFMGATREYVDYVLLGHFHSEKLKSYQGLKVINNGSLVGTEQYALSRRLFDKPSQSLLIFDSENLLNISINLDIS